MGNRLEKKKLILVCLFVSALFQSLLFEACGRTVNPVDGAVGLLSSGNWHVCQAAVETVLSGGTLRPITGVYNSGVIKPNSEENYVNPCMAKNQLPQSKALILKDGRDHHRKSDTDPSPATKFGGTGKRGRARRINAMSFYSDESEMTSFESGGSDERKKRGNQEKKLLNLFI